MWNLFEYLTLKKKYIPIYLIKLSPPSELRKASAYAAPRAFRQREAWEGEPRCFKVAGRPRSCDIAWSVLRRRHVYTTHKCDSRLCADEPDLQIGSFENDTSDRSNLRIILFVTKNNDLTQSDWDVQCGIFYILKNGMVKRSYCAPNMSTADLLQFRVRPEEM